MIGNTYIMELFDLVDIQDNVIGVTDKTTAHSTKQLHRVVAVYVFNKAGELYVQVHKSSGGLYDHSVGGHVSQGETYEAAAQREADEELGIKQQLDALTTFYSDEGDYLHMFSLFECVANNNWNFEANDEVEEIIPMNLDDIRKRMISSPEKFTGGFKSTMEQYCKLKNLK